MPNTNNCCTLEASQRLMAAGIVLETEADNEQWRDVIGYEGLYQVSNHGRVKSFKRRGNNRDRIMKPFRTSLNGSYRCVSLHKGGVDKRMSVHRLVATAFHPNPRSYAEVNHKDGNPANNHVDNLEWVSRSQNALHAYAIGLKTNLGENNSNHKLTKREVLFIRYIRGLYPNIGTTVIADFYGVVPQTITDILGFRRWQP